LHILISLAFKPPFDYNNNKMKRIYSNVNNNPTIKTLKKIADALEISLDELVGRKIDFKDKEK